MHVGTLPAAGTAATPDSVTGWVEITQIVDSTHFYVRRESSGTWPNITWDTAFNVTAGAVANITAGLGNAFVPPYGPWSIMRCTDCHGSTKTDPVGPHASVNKWLLKDADINLQFQWYNGTVSTINYQTAANIDGTNKVTDTKYFCYNCHRADVYGVAPGWTPATPPTIVNRLQGRVNHWDMAKADGANIAGNMPKWPQFCRHCHGGDKLGGIHGSNLPRVQGDNVPQSIRFLNGATWTNGFVRPTAASTTLTCYTQSKTQASTSTVSSCGAHGTGTSYTKGGTATYTYDGY